MCSSNLSLGVPNWTVIYIITTTPSNSPTENDVIDDAWFLRAITPSSARIA
jgi:hypothetical protein